MKRTTIRTTLVAVAAVLLGTVVAPAAQADVAPATDPAVTVADEPTRTKPIPDPNERPPAAGLFTLVGLTTRRPAVGVPATATATLRAIEPVSGLTLTLLSTAGAADAKGALAKTDLGTGRQLEVPLTLVPTGLGDAKAVYQVSGEIRDKVVTRTITLTSHVDADPAKSTFEQTLSRLLPEPPSMTMTTAAGPPSPTFGGNRSRPIIFLNGVDPIGSESSKNVNGEWAAHMAALQSWGWTGTMGGASFYECDTNYSWNLDNYGSHSRHLGGRTQSVNHQRDQFCGVFGSVTGGSHDVDTAIEHVAQHLAWMIRDVFGTTCVNVAGHSMGGLVIRYALAQVQHRNADFPSDICVDDVVTLGTPHGGSAGANACGWYQCLQQQPGSNFVTWLGSWARDPQASGGTDWTVMGSTADELAPPGSATTDNMSPAHAIVYEEPIEHSSAWVNQPDWKDQTSNDITANIRWTDRALGFQATSQDAPWPGRHMDMSLAYNHWGCGAGNTSSAFPLKTGVSTLGEPFTIDYDCWYYVDVPSGQAQLQVTMSSLNNRDLDLYVRNGSTTVTPTCSQGIAGSSHTCTINYPAAGRWYVQVDNDWSRSRDPFTVQATYSTVVHDLTTTSLTSYPSSVPPNQSFQVCWNVGGSGSITHTDLHYGASTGTGSMTPAVSGTAPQSFCAYPVAPASGNVYVQSHATGPNDDIYSTLVGIPVQSAQNDCGTGVDAGGTHAAATSISLPKTNCSGSMPSGDAEDWYRFSVTSGQLISVSVAPNSSSDFDLCLYDPAGNQVGCSTAGGSTTDSVTHTANSTGSWRARVYVYSGSGSYTLSASATSSSVTLREDDGEMDGQVPMNYYDDVAVKRLAVSSTQLSGKSTATLWIYGMSYRCGETPTAWHIRANDNVVADINPCGHWSSSVYEWRSFSFPVSGNVVAGTNAFDLVRHTGDWNTRALYAGIDYDRDYGNSDISYDGTSLGGELMWFLVLS